MLKRQYALTNGMTMHLVRNTDRYMKCQSCKTTADIMFVLELLDGSKRPSGSTCMRHVRLNAQRCVNYGLSLATEVSRRDA